MALQNAFGDLALDASLQSILIELQGKLDAGGTVALDAATLAALESITATVTNTDFPDAATLAKLEQIRVILAAGITVTGGLTDAQLRATPVPISGTVSTGGLTDTQIRATPLPVSGTVTANTGLTQPLTDTQLRATAVPVSGTVTATGPLTDTQLRATPVPISGTVTANTGLTQPLTDTQLRATAVPISDADVYVTGQSGQTTLGNNILLAVAGSTSYDTGNVSGQTLRSMYVQVVPAGTIAGGTIVMEQSADNVTFQAMYMNDDVLNNGATNTNFGVATGTSRFWSGPIRYRYLKFRLSVAVTGAGGSVQAFARFSPKPYTPVVMPVAQNSSFLIIQPPALTKGTQGVLGLAVQAYKDAGRVAVRFYANGVASGTTGTETAITLTKSADNGATSSAVSFVITSAKRFRIEAIFFASRGHNTATPQVTTFSIRINTAGAVTTTSTPVILSVRSATTLSNEWDKVNVPIPDGMETLGDGTIQIGITANAVFTTNAPTWDVAIIGYEY